MRIKEYIKFIICAVAFIVFLNAEFPLFAANNGIFDNRADVSQFRAKVKRDIFYTAEEKTGLLAPKAPENKEPKAQVPAVQTPAQPQKAEPPPVEKLPVAADENFRVEGIIRIGKGGCAIIDSKIWYIGQPNLGYEILKLYDEMVEIKTPDGRVLKCNLSKENSPGR